MDVINCKWNLTACEKLTVGPEKKKTEKQAKLNKKIKIHKDELTRKKNYPWNSTEYIPFCYEKFNKKKKKKLKAYPITR